VKSLLPLGPHYYWREQKKTELEEPISDLLNVTAKAKDHVFTDIFGKILLLQPITLLALLKGQSHEIFKVIL
jgi:hypothetical protein